MNQRRTQLFIQFAFQKTSFWNFSETCKITSSEAYINQASFFPIFYLFLTCKILTISHLVIALISLQTCLNPYKSSFILLLERPFYSTSMVMSYMLRPLQDSSLYRNYTNLFLWCSRSLKIQHYYISPSEILFFSNGTVFVDPTHGCSHTSTFLHFKFLYYYLMAIAVGVPFSDFCGMMSSQQSSMVHLSTL